MKEIWKDVIGYEGIYQVSNLGRVKSLERDVYNPLHGTIRRKEKIKKQWLNQDGYLIAKLCIDGENKNIPVHILVAKAFLGNYDYSDGLEVNHKDLDRTNNHVDNLEWLTHRGNIDYSVARGQYKHFGSDNPNYGNDTLRKRFENEPELRMIQSRKGKQNGRCVPIIIRDTNTNKEMKFDYLREAAEYFISNDLSKTKNLEGLANKFSKCLKTNETYNGYQILHA